MLTNLDDYPIHQFAEPMRYVASSDRNFYDRYYFMGFEKTGEAMFIAGLGVYPNLGVTDAFLAIMHKGQYRVVRASQELELSDRLKPSVGPISVDVVEALKRLRVRCEPNEWGIEFDCTFTGRHEAFEEPRHYVREQGRIIFDTTRLAQTGVWDGSITIPASDADGGVGGSKTFAVNGDSWYGTRDRSWGVRPIGESEPQGIRAKQPFSWFWLYMPVTFEDHSLMIIMQEHRDGGLFALAPVLHHEYLPEPGLGGFGFGYDEEGLANDKRLAIIVADELVEGIAEPAGERVIVEARQCLHWMAQVGLEVEFDRRIAQRPKRKGARLLAVDPLATALEFELDILPADGRGRTRIERRDLRGSVEVERITWRTVW